MDRQLLQHGLAAIAFIADLDDDSARLRPKIARGMTSRGAGFIELYVWTLYGCKLAPAT